MPAGRDEPSGDGLTDLGALAEGVAIERERPVAAAEATPSGAYTVGPGSGGAACLATPDVAAPEHTGGYFRSIGQTLLFPMKTGNLITFIVVWVIMSVQPVLAFGCIPGLIGMLFIQGWYCAFCLNAVQDATAGEEDLSQPSLTGAWIDEIIAPAIKFLVAWVVVRIPVTLYLLTTMLPRGIGIDEVTQLTSVLFLSTSDVFLEDSTAGEPAAFAAFYFGGTFLWPMVILIVAVGGIPGLLRIDLIVRTIFRTFPAYLCTVVLVYVALAIPVVYAMSGLALTQPSLSGLLLLGFFARGFEIYAMIVAMRVIGLYYHHFKRRFAWSWG
ncbi:MAG: hypothetical protein KKB50_10330 [Planctomycetes bacterium]|nr:hypothetical protein [Planctomycetota bacterium]